MKRKNKKFQKRGSNTLNKLSLFQKNDGRFTKQCPLSIKKAPIVDYKNISVLKNTCQIMEKLCLQKLHPYLLINKKN